MNKKKRRLISIIIPAKNRLELVEEALSSAINQKLLEGYESEIILVDNRSKPPLKKYLSNKYKKVRFVANDGVDSPGGSRNIGLKYLKGDYYAFLDSDDVWKEDFLYQSLLRLESDSKIAATVCLTDPYFSGQFPTSKKIKIIFLNTIRTLSLYISYILKNRTLYKSAFFLCQISHVVFRATEVKDIKFNDKTLAAEDWEYNVAATKRLPFGILLKKLVNFRYVVGSNTFSPSVISGKQKAYYDLINKLPPSHKSDIFYQLFLVYLKLFLLK